MESSINFQTLTEFPFPGLRAFETQESLLFFGREIHTEALLRRLGENRFLAVVGASGCGKSSLVRAGLLPALFRGYLVSSTSRWRFAVLRPGTKPIEALAAALAKTEALGSTQDEETLRKTLGATSGGLVEVVRKAHLAPGESLLVVVDQFEELFRFVREGGHGDAESQASLFVGLLLRAVESDVPIYVTLTMRSDYQGDCAQFPGLPEALNRSQYLVPRLTRDQRREAIVRPLELVGTAATPRLVNRLLNDAGDDPDQLPVLQHALLQTYRHWRRAGSKGEIDLADYEAIGGIANALGKHGDDILAGFSEEDRRLAEKIFRSLTTIERGRAVRRPKELSAIYDVVGAVDEPARQRVDAIVATFARREHSLLMLSSKELKPDTVVDVTHESLMRKWPRLAEWIREETRSAEWYSDLARDVDRYRAGDAGLWRDPQLSEVLKRRDRENWNEAWAIQYSQPDDPSFGEVGEFLDKSRAEQAEERRRKEEQWRKDLENAQALARAHRRASIALLLLLITILIAGTVVTLLNQRTESTIKDLTHQYLKAQEAYGEAQRSADQYKAQSEEIRRQYQAASSDEKAKLLKQLQDLQQNYNESHQKAIDYQTQITGLRENQDLAESDHNTLLSRIQSLQTQLNDVTADRDRLRYSQSPASNSSDLLQTQLAAAKAEAIRLRAELNMAVSRSQSPAQQRPTAAPPVFQVLSQRKVVHLDMAPFAGKVAIGTGDIPDSLPERLGVYIWTTDGRTPLPQACSDEKEGKNKPCAKSVRRVLDKQGCSGGGADGRSCFEVRRIDTILYPDRQQVGRFTLGGLAYEVRATGWSSHVSGQQDSISLAIYPVPQAAR